MTEPRTPRYEEPDGRRHSAGYLPFLILAGICAVFVLLVNPSGEFPLNDDWSYTRSAFRLGTGQGMHLDEWVAPSLVGQALYGGLLVGLLGPSFLALRLSTLLLSCATACLLWSILRHLDVREETAWVAVLGWIFNPIYFNLSFTYMTEVPFLFFIALSIALFARHLRTRRQWLLIGCSAALGYAFLIRQTAALFAASLACSLLFSGRQESLSRRLRDVALAAGPFAIFTAGYTLWSVGSGGATPAARRKIELLGLLTSKQLVGNMLGMLFYLSFMLLPIWLFMLPRVYRLVRLSAKKVQWGWTGAWVLLAGFGVLWFHLRHWQPQYLPSAAYHGKMPYLLNVLYDTGLGPLTLDPTYYGPPPTPVYPRVWLLVTGLTAAGLVAIGLIAVPCLKRISQADVGPERRLCFGFLLLSFSFASLFEIVFSHLQEGGLFDRHILTAALPLCLLLALVDRSSKDVPDCASMREPAAPDAGSRFRRRLTRGSCAASVLATMVLAWFSIVATHDYLAWNRVRWSLGRELLARGVDSLSVSGGFEFNGWYNYDTFRARGNVGKVYYWWYDRLDYLIAMSPVEGYRILQTREYASWLHLQRLPVHILVRSD